MELSCAAVGQIQRLWDVCEQQRKYTNTNKFEIIQMITRRIFGAEVVDSGGVGLCGEILALATQVGGEIVYCMSYLFMREALCVIRLLS